MIITRRSFLAGVAAATATRAFPAAKPAVDPDLVVLLSDVHVNGVPGRDAFQRDKFARVVADVLRMDPLPANAVFFGDLAWHHGRELDYRASLGGIRLLEDAGVKVTLGMGNHDRRSAFLKVHPSYARTTMIPGRIVSVCSVGRADFIMLDGLMGKDDRGPSDSGPGGCELDKAQQDWLLDVLPKWRCPVFVCSHWPIGGVVAGGRGIADLIFRSPAVAGYIHGHDHRWYKTLVRKNWKESPQIRTLCLPSTGHWGDIGYVTMRLSADRAVASLRQYEYFFPRPKPDDPKYVEIWRDITEENQNQSCTFRLPSIA